MTSSALPAFGKSTALLAGRDTGGLAELSSLSAHYAKCNGCKGRWFSIRCALDAVDAFVAPRFVTTVVVLGVVFGFAALAL